ncbi:MAG: c-type cytochrome [Acidobacteriaceae bacterium]
MAVASLLALSFVLLCGYSSSAESLSSLVAAKERGSTLFHTKGCAHCHGADLSGGRGPDLRNVGHRLTRRQIQRQIREGGRSMPGFDDVLKPSQIRDLVVMLEYEQSVKR